MKNLEEILHHYTRGDKPLNETNQALKELDCGLQLDPTRNLFSAQELAETVWVRRRTRPTAGA